jgi:hypothetical protein
MAPNVFFVCLHGSAKSVIAAEQLRRLAAARGVSIAVHSAGLEPDDAIPPRVVQGLLEEGIDGPADRGSRPPPTASRRPPSSPSAATWGPSQLARTTSSAGTTCPR